MSNYESNSSMPGNKRCIAPTSLSEEEEQADKKQKVNKSEIIVWSLVVVRNEYYGEPNSITCTQLFHTREEAEKRMCEILSREMKLLCAIEDDATRQRVCESLDNKSYEEILAYSRSPHIVGLGNEIFEHKIAEHRFEQHPE